MWTQFYIPKQKTASGSSKHDNSPNSRSTPPGAIVDSPEPSTSSLGADHHIGLHHRPSLTAVDERTNLNDGVHSDGSLEEADAGPSRRRLQAGYEGHDELDLATDRESFVLASDTDSASLQPTISRPQPPRGDTDIRPQEPRLIPPPSVHDSYISRFITPISQSPGHSPERPNMVRSNSAPGVPQSASKRDDLLPSALHVDTGQSQPQVAGSGDRKPIFDIFNADLSQPAEDMIKVLKGHLEEVLRVQEEIGRMHLGLEKLGGAYVDQDAWTKGDDSTPVGSPAQERTGLPSPPSFGTPEQKGTPGTNTETPGSAKRPEMDDALAKRQEGVEKIMERLESLSQSLRTYHQFGTPQISFPHSGSTPASARPRPRSSQPSHTSNPGHTISPIRDTHPPFSPHHPSPLRHIGDHTPHVPSPLAERRSASSVGISGMSGSPLEPSPGLPAGGLDPDSLEMTRLRPRSSVMGYDMDSLGDLQPNGNQGTHRNTTDDLWEKHLRGFAKEHGNVAATMDRRQRSSPVDTMDRTRPW